MKSTVIRWSLAGTALVGCALGLQACNTAANPAPGNSYSCPDDGTADIKPDNIGGTEKMRMKLKPGSTSDKDFTVEILARNIDPETGEFVWDKIDTIPITEENNPSFTLPPGSKARIVDGPNDPGSKKPSGTVTTV